MTEHRHREHAPEAAGPSKGTRVFGQPGIVEGVGDVDRSSPPNRKGMSVRGCEGTGKTRPSDRVAGVVRGHERGELDLVARDARQRAGMPTQQAYGTAENRVEHRLHIRLRPADHAQDVAGGGLRVERRGQLPVAGLQLREEPDILDGYDRLIREGLEQADLFLREWAHLESPDDDRSDRRLLA